MSILSWLQPSRPESHVDYYPSTLWRYPQSEDEWNQRYNWLWDAYMGAAYSPGDHKLMRLFRAFDDDGKLIGETRRVTRDLQHIVEVDVGAMGGERHSLEAARSGVKGRVRTGQQVWRRSRWTHKRVPAARNCAAMGDVFLEAQRSEGGGPARIVVHDPRNVRVEYDAAGLYIEKAWITDIYFDGDLRDPSGVPQEPMLRSKLRTLTADMIDSREADPHTGTAGRRIPGESGVHGLGVVPLVHVPFMEFGPPEHGLWAGHAMEPVIAQIDTHMAQLRAIANRYADPKLFLYGATLGSSSDVHKFGRVIANLPPDARAEYLEAGMGAISAIWQMIREYNTEVRHTIPEFLYAGAGANTSGRALDLWADRFRIKMTDVRTRWFDAIERVTQMCVLMDDDSAMDPDDHWFRITAPPVLPIDADTRIRHVQTALDKRIMKRADGVKQLQAIGLVDEEVDADKYLQELDATETAVEPPPMTGEDDNEE